MGEGGFLPALLKIRPPSLFLRRLHSYTQRTGGWSVKQSRETLLSKLACSSESSKGSGGGVEEEEEEEEEEGVGDRSVTGERRGSSRPPYSSLHVSPLSEPEDGGGGGGLSRRSLLFPGQD